MFNIPFHCSSFKDIQLHQLQDYYALSADFHLIFYSFHFLARKNEASPIETGYYFYCDFNAFLEPCQSHVVNEKHPFESLIILQEQSAPPKTQDKMETQNNNKFCVTLSFKHTFSCVFVLLTLKVHLQVCCSQLCLYSYLQQKLQRIAKSKILFSCMSLKIKAELFSQTAKTRSLKAKSCQLFSCKSSNLYWVLFA